jgi:enoyl-CoA hydratase/carnithine racemase
MILRAKKIDGPTALTIGLVHEVHPVSELKARALDLAQELAARPPLAVAGVLRAVVGAEHLSLDEALRVERDAVNRCSGTADQREGMRAFIEKRSAVFTGT